MAHNIVKWANSEQIFLVYYFLWLYCFGGGQNPTPTYYILEILWYFISIQQKKTLRLLSWWYNYAWREKHAMLRGRFVHKSQSIFSPKSQSIFSLSIWRSSLLMHYLIQKLYLKTSMMRTTPSVAAFFAWWHRGYKSYKLLSELALWSSLGKEAISETVFTSDSDHWPSPRVGKVKRVIG